MGVFGGIGSNRERRLREAQRRDREREQAARERAARIWGHNPFWKLVVPIFSVFIIISCTLTCIAANVDAADHKATVKENTKTYDSKLRDVVGPASDLAASLSGAWNANDVESARKLLSADSVDRASITTQSGGDVSWLGGAVVSDGQVKLRFVSLADGAIDTVVYGSTSFDPTTVSVDGVATTSGVKAPVTGAEHDEVVDKTNAVMDMVKRLRETQGAAPTIDSSDMDAIASARAQARAEAEAGA